MPQDPATRLAALLRAASIDDHEEILSAANIAIRANPNNETAHHTRVTALLKLDRFAEALRAISDGDLKLGTSCVLERTYALYKLGKLEEAASVLGSSGLLNRGLTHVAAQVAYRAEKFDKAQSIYHQLMAGDAAENHDVRINIKASQAQAEWKTLSGSSNFEPEKMPDTFELCYNAACASIARASLGTASRLLHRALALCDASDELTRTEKEDERKPILAQQAFVLAKLGRMDRATETLSSFDLDAETDDDFKLIVQNNRLALEAEPRNPFLLERQITSWRMTLQDKAKLFDFQLRILERNSSIADVEAHKINGVRSRTQRAIKQAQLPSSDSEINSISLIGTAAETQGMQNKSLLEFMAALLKKQPYDTALVLTIIQYHLEHKNPTAALHTLESFFSLLERPNKENLHFVRFSPGLVALAVFLKNRKGKHTSAKTELANAAKFWCNHPAGPAASLLKEAGTELVSSFSEDELECAGAAFARLYDDNPTSAIPAAGLVASLAASDASAVAKHIKQFPSIESLVNGIDVENLVDIGVAAPTGSSSSKKRVPQDDVTGDNAAKKRKRRRLPKNVVEDKTPDPERWLPLRDRSTYRLKGKKGRRKAAESTQGGVIKEEETIGLVGGGDVKVERATASSSTKKKKKSKK
ncbi:uncharacterized protein UV8b_03742 [Ustilaginoidea virens]|uniref:Signal recognition particle subunit SRP72 n=1 Tax=Ustilaginoidea virens TaxID=1159556 RepID=A0A8E5MH28_USTVR|nr:uncharacterized protein UV8b_03742 [Ustilaginoidea virens]QUC19501.1 hypothetical protein UV8b_03742 [Ustilaginoidea virens]